MAQRVKNLPAIQETQVQSLGQEDHQKGMTKYSCLGNPMDRGVWQGQRAGHDWVTNTFTLIYELKHNDFWVQAMIQKTYVNYKSSTLCKPAKHFDFKEGWLVTSRTLLTTRVKHYSKIKENNRSLHLMYRLQYLCQIT